MKCVKYLLFLFNLVFFIAGIGLLSTGIYVKVKLDEYYDFFGNDYMGPGILLIVVGVIILLLAFFGCCGAYKENYCLTMTFAVLLAIIFILEISGGIAGFVMRNQIEDDITQVLLDAEANYNTSEGVRKTWDKLHHEFNCCGVRNALEWKNITVEFPPDSCCNDDEKKCSYASIADKKGCEPAFEEWVKDKIMIIGGVAIGLAFIQIVGIIFACCLARAIQKEYEVV